MPGSCPGPMVVGAVSVNPDQGANGTKGTMMKVLKAGSRWKSAVCDTQVMVIRATAAEVNLCCGGVTMLAMDGTPPAGAALDAKHAEGTLIGKRYVDEKDEFEFLCTKGGKGSLSFGDAPLGVRAAKALPSSD